MNKVIITAAITGSINVPSMSPYLPITPEQIIQNAVDACNAGAAIAHIHVRNPETGEPTADTNLFRRVASGIKERCNMVLCITAGGALGMSLEQRLATVPELQPEMCGWTPGSINFGIWGMGERITEFKFDWEKPYLDGTFDLVFANTFKGMSTFAKTMMEHDTKSECEIFDVGMITNVRWLIDNGLLKEPAHVQFVMGIFGGIAATVNNLVHLYNFAKDTFGEGNFTWSVAAAGRNQMSMAAVSVAMGGNIRVGLEDSLRVGSQLAKSNAEQVKKAVQLVEALGLEVATADEARQILGLKGLDKVNF